MACDFKGPRIWCESRLPSRWTLFQRKQADNLQCRWEVFTRSCRTQRPEGEPLPRSARITLSSQASLCERALELPTCKSRYPSGAFLLCILPSCHSQERCRASPAPSPAWPRNLPINRTWGGGGAAPREAIISHGQKSHLPHPLLNSQTASKINHHHFLETQSDTGLSTVRAQKHEGE